MNNKERLRAIDELKHIQHITNLLIEAIAEKNRKECLELMREKKRLDADWFDQYSWPLVKREL